MIIEPNQNMKIDGRRSGQMTATPRMAARSPDGCKPWAFGKELAVSCWWLALNSPGLVLQEGERLLNKRFAVLEDAAMSSIRENAQLCVRQPAGQLE